MTISRPALVPLPPALDSAPRLSYASFLEEEYEVFKALLPERAWHETFAAWERDVERHMWIARVSGADPLRVTVPLADFVEWCMARNLPIEQSSLSKYASAHARR